MTKWSIPEGRKPLTDADIAALTRRLAGTAVDYKEMYEAAKRDAEEAEAYAAELEAKLDTKEKLLDEALEKLKDINDDSTKKSESETDPDTGDKELDQ